MLRQCLVNDIFWGYGRDGIDKAVLQGGQHLDLAQALAFEIEHYNRLVPTADRREGISAYNEKRKPKFEGR